MIGIIYHVVEKDTNRAIKVGSTIQSLEKRWRTYDKSRYSNHFLKEIKRIESGDLDAYDLKDSFCLFLWHLVASEHLEAVAQDTFQKGPLSNQFSPLVQKYIGFDAWEGSRLAGNAGNKIVVENKLGFLSPSFDRTSAARMGGRKSVDSGHLRRISSLGGKVSGKIQGKKNVESGWIKKVQKTGLGLGGKIGGPKGMHIRWHVKRGVVSPTCKLCITR